MKNIISINLLTMLLFISCSKSEPKENQIIKSSDDTKLSLDIGTANHLNISETNGAYTMNTTGYDPYIFSKSLSSKNKTENVVLSFEYSSTHPITLQIFLSPPTTESRSVNNIQLAASTSFKTFSVDLGEKINAFDWGSKNHALRFDFGNKAEVTIRLKNIVLRSRTDAEKKALEDKKAADLLEKERNELLKNYLTKNFPAQITEVSIEFDKIHINGKVPNTTDGYQLVELTPGTAIFDLKTIGNSHSITNTQFQITLDRINNHAGLNYDRGLSRWVIIKESQGKKEIQSHGHYADHITASRSLPKEQLQGKKGLGGYNIDRGPNSDLDDLGITSSTVNITLTEFTYLTDPGNAIPYTYLNKTYYFSRYFVDNLDRTLKETTSRNIINAGIILIRGKAFAADPKVGELLEHPDHQPGDNVFFTMPRMDNLESVHCYAAALDFLANRYCQEGNPYGRLHHLIIHNEVDQGAIWTNMGYNRPLYIFLDNYYHSMRLANNIIKSYDANAEVFTSFTHSWNAAAEGGDYFGDSYSTKEMTEGLLKYSSVEGEFNWGMAIHPYPQDLNEPKTWNDTRATFSMKTEIISFKNLEVINEWIWKSENMYKGTTKRSLWLSENGTNSRTYSAQDLAEQAAGFAYAWKKIKQLDGIDGIQWHNWIDNRHEFGLRIGLRRYPDDQEDPGGKKPVWYLYQAAGTAQEDAVFEPYKSIIGISNWSELDKKPVTP